MNLEALAKWGDAFNKEQLDAVADKIEEEGGEICPAPNDIFKAFELVEPNDVRVVIIGQDPYPDPLHAHGLAFSSNHPWEVPGSLRNIFKELDRDVYFGVNIKHSNDLTRWAKQGILLLNSSLTCQVGLPASHKNFGWEPVTDGVIKYLNDNYENIIFLLWGRHAKRKAALIDGDKHIILSSSHPSPLAAHNGFHGCSHFSLTNTILIQNHKEPIEW